MPRHATKTYGRNGNGGQSNKAFDDAIRRASGRDKVFGDVTKNNKMSTAMASSSIKMFGNASFTSTRSNQVIEIEPRKRPAEEPPEPSLFDDPFSFDSDDDGPSKPKKGMGFKKARANPLQKNSRSSSRNSSDTESNGHVSVAAKVAPRACVRAKASAKRVPNNNTVTDAKQTSMDSFMLKITNSEGNGQEQTFSANLSNLSEEKPGTKKQTKRLLVHKFFTSKNSGDSADDHNYSANLSSTQSLMRDEHCYSQTERSMTGSPAGKDIWSSDYDSDWDAESGDPEIVFNSPKKKALAAREKSRTLNFLPGRAVKNLQKEALLNSPITISSGAEEDDASSLCSDISAKSNNTDLVSGSDPEEEDDNEESTFRTFPQHRTIRTYGKARSKDSLPLSSSSGSEPATSSSGAGSGLPLNSLAGLTNKKTAAVPTLKKFSSLQETDLGRKTEALSKPAVRRLLTSPKKGEGKVKAVYNPRSSWQMGSDGSSVQNSQKSAASGSLFEEFDEEPAPVKVAPVIKRSVKGPQRPWDDRVSTLKISREHKPLFTVVRNVKQAHECQEHGETQEFEDDILYILEGVKQTETTSTRCLSTISLASKCTMPAFRMHLRAHNTLSYVFSALQDAPDDPTLALCTAAVMYMMSRDRLNMDLEQSTLQLMLALLSVNSQEMAHCEDTSTQTEYDRLCSRVQSITQSMKREGGIKNNKMLELELADISIGYLAMETLLSLTSKSAGDWFKEELRTHGGLDHIINTVSSCSEELDDYVIEPTESMLEKFSKIDRCLRVLENVTYMNADNQTYLISYKSSLLIKSLYKTLRVCENCMPFNRVTTEGEDKVNKESPGYTIYSCALSVLRVLLNLTHDHMVGSTKTGQVHGLMSTVLACILRVPQYVPVDQRFDILVLSLGLLINMVEHCEGNKRMLIDTKTVKPYSTTSVVNGQVKSMEALSLLFNECYEAARLMEEEHDAELEEREKMKDGGRTNTTGGSQRSATMTDSDPNKSGEWKESESGLEWVVIPMDEDQRAGGGAETDPDRILEQGGTLRDALRNHYNQDNQFGAGEPGEDDDSDDLEVVPGSQEEDENFTKALHKYGRHMEDSIVAAYVALLLGCVVQGDSYLADEVRDYMSGCSFEGMIRMLKKFLGFMNFTSTSTGNTGSKSITRVIEILEAFS